MKFNSSCLFVVTLIAVFSITNPINAEEIAKKPNIVGSLNPETHTSIKKETYTLDFSSKTPVQAQIRQLDKSIQNCVADAFKATGLLDYIQNKNNTGKLPVVRQTPQEQTLKCANKAIRVSFNSITIPKGDQPGATYQSLGEAIIEILSDIWDLGCREINCLSGAGTCGCKESTFADCGDPECVTNNGELPTQNTQGAEDGE